MQTKMDKIVLLSVKLKVDTLSVNKMILYVKRNIILENIHFWEEAVNTDSSPSGPACGWGKGWTDALDL